MSKHLAMARDSLNKLHAGLAAGDAKSLDFLVVWAGQVQDALEALHEVLGEVDLKPASWISDDPNDFDVLARRREP